MLRLESKGQAVIDLQMKLRRTGDYDKNVTGEVDKSTDKAIRAFQKREKLTVDGIAGPRTNERLGNRVGNKYFSLLVLHCSATKEGQNVTAANVEYYHRVIRKWSRPGYSDYIELNGKIVNLRNWDMNNEIESNEYTWGVLGQLNRHARHICYAGGLNKQREVEDTRTPAQLEAMEVYVKFMILMNPDIVICGHYALQRKGCPSFNVEEWLEEIGVPERNRCHWGRMYK